MNRILLFLLTISTPFVLATGATAQPAGASIEGIVAVVNDDVVLRSELDMRVNRIRLQMEEEGAQLPPERILERQVAERLINERLQLQRAEQMGIEVSDDMLNQMMTDIARSNGYDNVDDFIDVLEADGLDYAAVREEVRNDVIMTRLRQRDVLSRVSVTRREVESFLASQAGQEFDNREFLVSHIALRVEGSGNEAIARTREQGEEILSRLEEGEAFSQLAYEFSQGEQALEGGSLGWRRSTQLPALFAEQVVSMQPGEVSDLIRTSGAYHIIRLDDVRGDEQRMMVEQVRARHILLRTTALVDDNRARARLDEIRARLLNGADFAELAREHSDDPGSAVDGGDLGWVEPGDTAGPFEERLRTLEPDVVSEPFSTQFGWHIVEVLDRREYDSTNEMRINRARSALRERKAEERLDRWMMQLRDEAYIDNRLES